MRAYLSVLSGALIVITVTYVASNNQVPSIVTPATAADTMETPVKPVQEIAKANSLQCASFYLRLTASDINRYS